MQFPRREIICHLEPFFSLFHAIVLGRLLASLATIWDDLPTQVIIQCTIGNTKNQPVSGQFQHVSFVTSPSFVVRRRQPTATPEDVTPFATSTSARSFSARSSCMRLKLSWQKPRLGSASACWFMDVFMESLWLFTGTKSNGYKWYKWFILKNSGGNIIDSSGIPCRCVWIILNNQHGSFESFCIRMPWINANPIDSSGIHYRLHPAMLASSTPSGQSFTANPAQWTPILSGCVFNLEKP